MRLKLSQLPKVKINVIAYQKYYIFFKKVKEIIMSLNKGRNETPTIEAPPDTIGDGNCTVTTAGTRVQLTTTATPCKKVLITANGANTGNIYVGGVTIASGRGKQLVPLQDVEIWIDDLSKVYIDASVSLEGVAYVYVA